MLKQKFKNKPLSVITKQTKEMFISPTLHSCNTCIVSFDLWMSRGGVYTFVFIMHFLNDNWWEPCHVIVGFFEIANTSRNAIVLQENNVLVKHMFDIYVFAYVRDERNNLSTMTFILTSIVSYMKFWDHRHLLEGLIGAMQCPSVVNMPQMIPNYVLA